MSGRQHLPGGRPGAAASPLDWAWCLDLHQSFDALVRIAGGLAGAPLRPVDDVETGGPLLNLYLVVCALAQVLGEHARSLRRPHRSVRGPGLYERERVLQELARALATRLLDGEQAPGRSDLEVVGSIQRVRWPTGLRRARMRVPECFRNADLYPSDCELIAARAADAETDLGPPALVVGLSTSGCYLGPLCEAALARRGYERLGRLALWPGLAPPGRDARLIRRVAADRGWALVVGATTGDAAGWEGAMAALTDLGLAESRIRLAGRGPALAPIQGRARELMGRWAVEHWLNRPAVLVRLGSDAASVMGESRPVLGGGAGARCQPPARAFEVELSRGGERWREHVLVRRVGPGFFGYHAWMVAACLGDQVPEVLGIHDGMLVTRWLAGPAHPRRVELEDLEAIAGYVAARARRLEVRVAESPPSEPCARDAVGGQVARLLAGAARGRSPGIESQIAARLTREVRPARRSIVDGRMGADEWVRRAGGGLLKVRSEARREDVADPVHDLAAAVVGLRLEPDEERHLVEAYERLTGDTLDGQARLALHRLHLAGAELAGLAEMGCDLVSRSDRMKFARELAIRETLCARAINGYLAGVYRADATPEEARATWAVDMDGLLETDGPGFECTSPAGALGLWLLRAHGHQVYGYTARSLGELRERCRTFGLAGGVAEGGAVAWDAGSREAIPLVEPADQEVLTRLRAAVLDETDLLADPRGRHSLSLFWYGRGGRRGPGRDEVQALLARHGVQDVRLTVSARATAVGHAGVSTGLAFERLRARHAAGARLPFIVFVQREADVGLLETADGRFAAASVEAELRGRARSLRLTITSRPSRAGFLQAVLRAVHPVRGACATCRRWPPPRPSRADAAMVDALRVLDRS